MQESMWSHEEVFTLIDAAEDVREYGDRELGLRPVMKAWSDARASFDCAVDGYLVEPEATEAKGRLLAASKAVHESVRELIAPELKEMLAGAEVKARRGRLRVVRRGEVRIQE
jgi:hypothetical protein